MGRIAWVGLLCLWLPLSALACRCAPQSLAAYFEQADEVVVARLQAAADGNEPGTRVLSFQPIGARYKPASPLAGAPSQLAYQTADSSATCGLSADPGGVYILFARRIPGQSLGRVDSCSGSRLLLGSDGAPGTDFIDTPLRFAPRQLNGLSGLFVLARVAENQPDAGNPDNAVLIGLLDIKTLAHGGPVVLRGSPSANAEALAEITALDALETREAGYEQPAAVVYARVHGWLRVRLAGGGAYGWIAPSDAGTFFSYQQLPVRRLAYLTNDWSGFLWPDAGAGLPIRYLADEEAVSRGQHPVEIQDSARIGGSLWFKVRLLDNDGCDGQPAKQRGGGWAPGYGMSGQANVWFHSRGC
jgi:hypothetical protein